MVFKPEVPKNNIESYDIEKLKSLERELSSRLVEAGIPVDDECRVFMDSFREIYPQEEINRDKGEVARLESLWYKDKNPDEIKEERLKRDGEQFEVLKTVIFNKFLGEDFIVVRSSPYDDYKNQVDNLFLDKKTGNLVCAFDEVTSLSGKEFEDKKEKVALRNRSKTPTNLKYGLMIKDGAVFGGASQHFPIFYLAIRPEVLKEGIKRAGASLEEKTDYEKKLFTFLVDQIDLQIKDLELSPIYDKELLSSLRFFKGVLGEIKKDWGP